jgi:glutamate racemase
MLIHRRIMDTNKDMCFRPVGVFDSGVGGISVLRCLASLMPNEDFIFYGDSANAPYGTKTLEEVERLSMADAEYLIDKGVKAIVVACNTATSAAIVKLREKYAHMPVVGIEPALKPAVLAALSGQSEEPGTALIAPEMKPRIVVMATPMTLREEKFHNLMRAYDDKADIISLPCPGLVEYVERGELSGAGIESFLSGLFAPYTDIDCVVLGCTHYPFVRRAVEKVLGENVRIFDGGEGTARETLRRLKECDLCNPKEERGHITIMNSDTSTELSELGHMLFEMK